MKHCSKCGLNFLDHMDRCTDCGAALTARIGTPDRVEFLATLQHLPADISNKYKGAVVLSNIRGGLLHKADQVLLSQLACDEITVRVSLEAD